MAAPSWLKTISNHAIISKKELLEWLGVTSEQLRIMSEDASFPPPRITGSQQKPGSTRLSSTNRWRVGDVRAWLKGSASLEKELSTEIGAEQIKCTKIAEIRRLAGFSDKNGNPVKRW